MKVEVVKRYTPTNTLLDFYVADCLILSLRNQLASDAMLQFVETTRESDIFTAEELENIEFYWGTEGV